MNSFFHGLIQRPITVLMFFLGMMLLGCISIAFVPVSLLPNTAYPALTLEVEYQGVGPDKIEDIITKPLEEAVSTVGAIEQIYSTSEEGKSRINLEFDRNVDLDIKGLEVREQIEPVAAAFPREVREPMLRRFDPDRRPVIVITFESDRLGQEEIREIVESVVKKDLESIEGASDIIVAGGRLQEVQVRCDKEALEVYSLSLGEVMQAIRSANLNMSLGEINKDGGHVPIYFRGKFQRIDQLSNLTIRTDLSGKRVQLKDVAKISYAYRDSDSASRVNGEERVSLYVHKAGISNLLQLSDDVRNSLQKLEYDHLSYTITYDQAELIRTAFKNLVLASGAGLILLMAVLRIGLGGWVNAALAMILLPATFMISSFVLYLVGLEYNIITITGMLLSTGIGSTYAIIVLFQASRNVPVLRILRMFSGEMLTGVLFISAVFIPILYTNEEFRLIYGGLAVTVVLSLVVSLCICFALYPVILENYIKPIAEVGARPHFDASAVESENEVETGRRERWEAFIRILFARMLRLPDRLLQIACGRIEIFVIAYAVFILMGIVAYYNTPQQFISSISQNQINAAVEFPSGTSFAATNDVTKKIEAKIAELEPVKRLTSRVDAGHSDLQIELNDGYDADHETIDFFKQELGETDPAFVYFSLESEVGALRDITIDILGEDLQTLDEITREYAEAAEKIPGVSDVVLRYKSPRPENVLIVDRLKADRSALTVQTVGESLRFAIQGGVATKYVHDNHEMDVRIRYDDRFRAELEKLEEFKIKGGNGMVPLFALARMEEGETPVKIYRKNKKRSLSFSARVSEEQFADAMRGLESLMSAPLPENYQVVFDRKFLETLEVQNRVGYTVALGLLLVYMIFASYFESLSQPLILLAPLPVPIFSAIILMSIFDQILTISVLIGLFLLGAIVAIHAILSLRAYTPLESNSISVMLGRNDLREMFLLIAIALVGFYLPLCMIFGDGGNILRGIAMPIMIGNAVSCLTTPVILDIIKSSEMKTEFRRMTVFIKGVGQRVAQVVQNRLRNFTQR